MNRSRISTAVATTLVSLMFLSTAVAFAPSSVQQQQQLHQPSITYSASQRSIIPSPTTTPKTTALQMSLSDVSDFYAQNPLQAAVLTCGVKASVADGIAQIRALADGARSNKWQIDDLEFRRNIAYVLYGGIFIGALCHYEYDVLFPILFGTEHSLWTSLQEVLFDNFVSGPLVWLPPAYIIKAVVYDYPLQEGLQKYINDVKNEGLLEKYWSIWIPAQGISFTVVPDHLRVVFMASVSFFWFILFSTVASGSNSADEVNA